MRLVGQREGRGAARHPRALPAFLGPHRLDRNRTLWGGFVIEAPDGACIYFAGDSDWCPHFAEIGRRFPRIDLALLPIGAYAPRWFMRTQHMDPEEAVRAHLACGARASLAMQFGTFFRLTDEPIDEPASLLRDAMARHGVAPGAFRVPGFGETLLFDAPRNIQKSCRAASVT